MSRSRAARNAGRYAAIAAIVVVACGAAMLAWAVQEGHDALLWGVLGWALLALTGVAGGAWLAFEHGKPGTGFLKAMVAGMLTRLFLAAAGGGLAAWTGGNAPWAFLGGAVAGFVPLQIVEVIWFFRAGQKAAGSRTGGRAPAL
jgi:hypothetical protein